MIRNQRIMNGETGYSNSMKSFVKINIRIKQANT
jgi:hypothetical protein